MFTETQRVGRSWVTTYPHLSIFVPTVIFRCLHQTQTCCLLCIRTLPCSEIQTIIMVPKMMAIRTSCFFCRSSSWFARGVTSRSTFLGRRQPLSREKQGWRLDQNTTNLPMHKQFFKLFGQTSPQQIRLQRNRGAQVILLLGQGGAGILFAFFLRLKIIPGSKKVYLWKFQLLR